MGIERVLKRLATVREERHKWYLYSGVTLTVLAIALVAGRQPHQEAVDRPIVTVRHEEGMSTGTPVKWLGDHITIQTADDRYETFRIEELVEVTSSLPRKLEGAEGRRFKGRPHRRRRSAVVGAPSGNSASTEGNVQVVSWRFIRSDGQAIEKVEGCSSMTLREPESANGIEVLCGAHDGVVEFRVPESTFGILAWSLRDEAGGFSISFALRDEDAMVGRRTNGDTLEIVFSRSHDRATLTRTFGPLADHRGSEVEYWEDRYRRLKQSAEVGFDDPVEQLGLVQTCFELSRLEEARFWLNNLLERFPANPEYRYWEGVILLVEGAVPDAIEALESVEPNIRQTLPEVHMYLGLAYWNMMMKEESCKLFHLYSKEAPNSKYVEEINVSIVRECGGVQ